MSLTNLQHEEVLLLSIEADPSQHNEFRNYLRSLYLEELWMFRREVIRFKSESIKLGAAGRYVRAKGITEALVTTNSPLQVNIAESMRREIEDTLEKCGNGSIDDVPVTVFDEALQEVTTLLLTNIMFSFNNNNTPSVSVASSSKSMFFGRSTTYGSSIIGSTGTGSNSSFKTSSMSPSSLSEKLQGAASPSSPRSRRLSMSPNPMQSVRSILRLSASGSSLSPKGKSRANSSNHIVPKVSTLDLGSTGRSLSFSSTSSS